MNYSLFRGGSVEIGGFAVHGKWCFLSLGRDGLGLIQARVVSLAWHPLNCCLLRNVLKTGGAENGSF